MGDVLVLAEHRRGELREITYEMLGAASDLAGELGGQAVALLVGDSTDGLTADIASCGIKVVAVDHPLLKHYNSDKYQKVVSHVIDELKPELVMIGHTIQGVDLAPALAVEKDLPLVPDVIGFHLEGEILKVTRQLYSGKANALIAFKPAATYLVTVREAAFEALAPGGSGSVEKVNSPLTEDLHYRKFVEYVEAEVGEVDIAQSGVLVSIGRGIREEKNLPLIEELAEVVKGDLCGSRAAVDAGWITHDRQVGTSGKTVKPRLYIALGVSGAFQHLAGIKGAKTIVAVNKDPEAPILAAANYAVVDDLLKIVPRLTEKLKELKG